MSSIDVKDTSGGTAGTVELDDAVFGVQPNVPVMHQVVTAQLAARRAGGQHSRTRAEVAGGGAKPWKQKGTGRARQGSSRSPHWRGGGVAFAPKHRDYAQRTPKKMVRLALRSALSDRAADGKVVVVDDWGMSTPRTKDALAALEALGLDGRVMVVLTEADEMVWRSFRNLGWVHCVLTRELAAYDVLCSDWVVFTRASLPGAAPSEATEPSEANEPTGDTEPTEDTEPSETPVAVAPAPTPEPESDLDTGGEEE